MNKVKLVCLATLFLCGNAHATGNVAFSTELSSGQKEESVTLTFDTGDVCKLHVKSFFGLSGTDSCKFQPSQRLHHFSIKGEVRQENYDETGIETMQGEGEGFVVNLEPDMKQLNAAENIDQLFKVYQDAIAGINSHLPDNIPRIPQLTFSRPETVDTIQAYQSQHDIGLPSIYIKMLTDYGYPKYFLPLAEQESIATVYMDEYGYSKSQFNHHDGIEKHRVFFRESEEVAYVFHDNTKAACNNEPVVDYTIITEGDYAELHTDNIEQSACGQFFSFLKKELIERFINDIFYETNMLPVYKDVTLQADLSYNWPDEDSTLLDYYFDYNEIFY